MAGKIPSPAFNNTGAPTSSQISLPSLSSIDPLRQYLIFELLNPGPHHGDAEVPQSMPIFPFLIMHMNPDTFEESYQKLITRQITRGGFLEQHWGEELDTINCSGSTGAFVTVSNGLSFLNRKASVAYRKFLELVALYRNGGNVYDGRGNVIFHGGVKLHFDSNMYEGFFENLTVAENSDNPFAFRCDFTFKVHHQFRTVGR